MSLLHKKSKADISPESNRLSPYFDEPILIKLVKLVHNFAFEVNFYFLNRSIP